MNRDEGGSRLGHVWDSLLATPSSNKKYIFYFKILIFLMSALCNNFVLLVSITFNLHSQSDCIKGYMSYTVKALYLHNHTNV